jgi:hypothetical protein
MRAKWGRLALAAGLLASSAQGMAQTSYYMRVIVGPPKSSPSPALPSVKEESAPVPVPTTPIATPSPPIAIETPAAPPAVVLPAGTDPTDMSNPGPAKPEEEVSGSTEPASKPAGYQSPTAVPPRADACDGDIRTISESTAGAMGQKITMWSLGLKWLFGFSVWRIRNANAVPVTVTLSGGVLSKTVTVPARADIIVVSLSIGRYEHSLWLKGRMVDRKAPSGSTYTAC